MKKLSVCFVCFIFSLFYCFSIISVEASRDGNLSITENFMYTDGEKTIFGNLSEMDEEISTTIKQVLRDSKHVLLYDLSKKVVSYKSNEDNDGVVATAYSRQNGILYRRTYSTNEINPTVLLNDIEVFFSNFIDEVTEQKKAEIQAMNDPSAVKGTMINSTTSAITINDFVKVEVDSGECVEKPHGKIVYVTNVYVSQPDSLYSIYIVETSTEFVPGYTLKGLGDTTYQNYISTKSRQKTSITPVVRSYYGYVYYGENPNVLEYWPKNAVSNRTISTSFGIGAEIGFSHEDGFSGAITGNFAYSQSYETTDPSMSASTLIIGEEYGWYFQYSNVGVRRVTHHFDSGEMVEMLNGQFNGEFIVEHELWYRVDMFLGHTTEISFSPAFTVYAFDGQI